MARPTRARLNTQALLHNLQQVRRHAPRARAMAVVKANAYGHGLAWVATTLKSADAFAVASIEEGLVLRTAGVKQPIVLLEGFFGADELSSLQSRQLSPVLHSEHQLRLLEADSVPLPASVWIKLDTGMHRIGFAPEMLAGKDKQGMSKPGVMEIAPLVVVERGQL